MKQEITRTRQGGTLVCNPQNGDERIAAIRAIVDNCQYAKVDGVMVDLFTASTIMQVYDAIDTGNQEKYKKHPVTVMAGIAYKCTEKKG